MKLNRDLIEEYFYRYITEYEVSEPHTNWHFCTLILDALEEFEPHSILNIGGGFPTFIFNLYRKHHPDRITIATINDDKFSSNLVNSFLVGAAEMKKHRFQSGYPIGLYDLIVNHLETKLGEKLLRVSFVDLNHRGVMVLDDRGDLDRTLAYQSEYNGRLEASGLTNYLVRKNDR